VPEQAPDKKQNYQCSGNAAPPPEATLRQHWGNIGATLGQHWGHIEATLGENGSFCNCWVAVAYLCCSQGDRHTRQPSCVSVPLYTMSQLNRMGNWTVKPPNHNGERKRHGKEKGGVVMLSIHQRFLHHILVQCPVTASRVESCLLCCQPEPVPQSLPARTPQLTLQ